MGKSRHPEKDPFRGFVEPETRRGTRIAEATRSIIASLNDIPEPVAMDLPDVYVPRAPEELDLA